MSFVSEFKEFISKGNALDLAVGVIIGAAFGKIVDSIVNDLIMPVVGLATGGIDFSNMFMVLKAPVGADVSTLEAAKKAGAVTLNYGNFVTIVFNFLILAFVIFMLVKQVNRIKKAPESAPAEPAGPTSEELLAEIRDVLKSK